MKTILRIFTICVLTCASFSLVNRSNASENEEPDNSEIWSLIYGFCNDKDSKEALLVTKKAVFAQIVKYAKICLIPNDKNCKEGYEFGVPGAQWQFKGLIFKNNKDGEFIETAIPEILKNPTIVNKEKIRLLKLSNCCAFTSCKLDVNFKEQLQSLVLENDEIVEVEEIKGLPTLTALKIFYQNGKELYIINCPNLEELHTYIPRMQNFDIEECLPNRAKEDKSEKKRKALQKKLAKYGLGKIRKACIEEKTELTDVLVYVSIFAQEAYVFKSETETNRSAKYNPDKKTYELCAVFPVSTSVKPCSIKEGSCGSPLGLHRIKETFPKRDGEGSLIETKGPLVEANEGNFVKLDPNLPYIFSSRIAQGLAGDGKTKQTGMTTRILWIEGCVPGYNKTESERYIYAHGNDESHLINAGKRLSHGCFRFIKQDIIKLFDIAKPGTIVFIDP